MKNLIIRPTVIKDARGIYDIRNHPISRQFSNNQEEICYEFHKDWFANRYFGGKPHVCYILEENNEVIGYCRFDYSLDGKDEFILSIAIHPDKLGRGYGTKLLEESLIKFGSDKKIVAEVLNENLISQKLLKRQGFIIMGKDPEKTIFELKK